VGRRKRDRILLESVPKRRGGVDSKEELGKARTIAEG